MTGGDLPLMHPKVELSFYRFSSTFVLLNPLQINPFLFISPIFTHLYSFSSTIIQFHSYHPRSSILIHIIVKQLCSILIPFFVIVEPLSKSIVQTSPSTSTLPSAKSPQLNILLFHLFYLLIPIVPAPIVCCTGPAVIAGYGGWF